MKDSHLMINNAANNLDLDIKNTTSDVSNLDLEASGRLSPRATGINLNGQQMVTKIYSGYDDEQI